MKSISIKKQNFAPKIVVLFALVQDKLRLQKDFKKIKWLPDKWETPFTSARFFAVAQRALYWATK